MHPDILHLAERLVIAMESMSQDVKLTSAYVCEISNTRQKTSAEDEYPLQNEQTDGNSALLVDGLKQGRTSTGGVASMDVDHNEDASVLPSFTGGIWIGGQSETTEVGESGKCNILDHGTNNMIEGNNRQSLIQGHARWYSLQTASSSSSSTESVESELIIINSQNLLSKNSSSEHECVALPSLEYENSFAGASCSTADDTVNQEEVVDAHSFLGHVEQVQNSNQSETQLSASLRSSSKERRFKCGRCGMDFMKLYNLSTHMRTHTGEKPYKCSECEKSFAQNGVLTRHLRCHTGDQPFKCTYCGKSFTRSDNLTVHMRNHTGELPYSCSVCGQRFKSSAHLSDHKHRFHATAS